RKENEDELNMMVEEWTRHFSPEEVMRCMQGAGVPAGVVQSGEGLVKDAQLNHRGTHVILNHPEVGEHIYAQPPYRLSKTHPELTMPAPCIGQHNEYVLKEILGMSDDEVADLIIEGALE
ncbi:MAG: CoA transferase, partial [Dehalococcoidia bacterium]